MCFLRPLTIVKITGRAAELENGLKALYDKSIGEIKPGDKVLVYGNLVVEKIGFGDKKD